MDSDRRNGKGDKNCNPIAKATTLILHNSTKTAGYENHKIRKHIIKYNAAITLALLEDDQDKCSNHGKVERTYPR